MGGYACIGNSFILWLHEDFAGQKRFLKGKLIDYKFFCFQGEPKFLYISEGLENHKTARMSFVTLDWEPVSYKRMDYKQFDKLPEKPKSFDKMLEISRILSKDIPHVRVDLYEINGQVYFGEMTFFNGAGFTPYDEESDNKIGTYLTLPKVQNIPYISGGGYSKNASCKEAA